MRAVISQLHNKLKSQGRTFKSIKLVEGGGEAEELWDVDEILDDALGSPPKLEVICEIGTIPFSCSFLCPMFLKAVHLDRSGLALGRKLKEPEA